VQAAIINEFIDDRRLRLFYEDNLVCDLGMGFLHDGRLRVERQAVWGQESAVTVFRFS